MRKQKAPKLVILDTVPLLLLLVGAFDRSYLLKFMMIMLRRK